MQVASRFDQGDGEQTIFIQVGQQVSRQAAVIRVNIWRDLAENIDRQFFPGG